MNFKFRNANLCLAEGEMDVKLCAGRKKDRSVEKTQNSFNFKRVTHPLNFEGLNVSRLTLSTHKKDM
jgi:hypothetical protein